MNNPDTVYEISICRKSTYTSFGPAIEQEIKVSVHRGLTSSSKRIVEMTYSGTLEEGNNIIKFISDIIEGQE